MSLAMPPRAEYDGDGDAAAVSDDDAGGGGSGGGAQESTPRIREVGR